jgi:thioredoxin 1
MKHTNHVGGTAGRCAHEFTRIGAVVLLTALAVGGCSPAVRPQPADDAKAAATGNATTTVPPQTDGKVADTAATTSPAENVAKGLPRLVDLGAGKCIPCKLMAPILEQLKVEYAAVFSVEFIDVWQHPEEGDKYGIKMIPTQIFFDASGKEVFRHEGFFSKEEILAKWKEFNVERKEGKDV